MKRMQQAPATRGTALTLPARLCAARVLAFLILLLIGMQAARATDWYVDGLNGRDTNRGTKTTPFLNVWRAWSAAQPGDTLHLLPTTVYGPLYFSGKSGTASQPITIQGDGVAPNLTQVSGRGDNFGIDLERDTNYVTIQNLNITAPGAGRYGAWSGIYLTQNHHVRIVSNYVHDAGCSGIQTANSDYVTISANRVVHNATLTTNGIFCSGISMHEDLDSDGNTGVKMQISGNIVYGNTNVPLADCIYPCTDSDGNGIIVDDTRRTQSDNQAYQGITLVENNVVFNNGGRGLHIYSSDNVSVRTNTFYQNNQDPYEGYWRPGEISVSYSGGVSIYNNILFSDGASGTVNTGAHAAVSVEDCTTGGPVVMDYNLAFNPQNDPGLNTFVRNNTVPITIGPSNKWGNPLFKSASVDPLAANFQVITGSPALGTSSPAGTYPTTDILGVVRNPTVTLGAYQKPAK